jgi:H+-translocating NAD(P) transhydrogenase subunit alpha
MTGALLVAFYLLALALFLGLDIVGKVPAALYATLIAALGALSGVTVLAGVYLQGPRAVSGAAGLGRVGMGVGLVAAVAGLTAMGRLLASYHKKSPGHE